MPKTKTAPKSKKAPKTKTAPKSKSAPTETNSKPPISLSQIAKLGSLGGLGVIALTMLKLILTNNPLLFKKLISYLWSISTGFVTGGYTAIVLNAITALGVFDLLEDATGQLMPEQQREMIIRAWMNIVTMFGYNVKYKGEAEARTAMGQIDVLNNGLGEIEMGADIEPPAETVEPVTYSPLVVTIPPPTNYRLPSLVSNSTSSGSIPTTPDQPSPSFYSIESMGDYFAGLIENLSLLSKKRPAMDELEKEPKRIAL